jgi:phosphoglycolate phosphatase
MKKAVIFDLDGTLLHTIDDIHIAVNHALKLYGFKPVAVKDTISNIGHGAYNLIKQILIGEDVSIVKKVYQTYQNYYDHHLIVHTRPFEGIDEVLRDLMQKGTMIGIVSNKHHYLVQELVKHFFPKVTYFSGMKASVPIKPNPDMLLNTIHDMGILKKDIYFVGDSEADILCAKASKVDMVAVSYGYRNRQILMDLHPQIIVDTVKALHTYLKENV